MSDNKPTRWDYMTTAAIAVLCASWAVYEYITEPSKFPFEPLIAFITSAFAIWGYNRWKKSEGANPPTEITHYHYGEKAIPRLLSNPPFNSDFFLGRENDLEAIETEYQKDNRLLVLVNGEGGIGKTTLTAKYWYKHAERYKHLAWLYADTGIGNALVTLKDKLGVEFEQNDTLETQVQRITEAINNLATPCLLVFDNANDDTDLKKYYTVLKRLANCHVLLTSRVNKLDELKVHRIMPLTEAESIDQVKRIKKDKVVLLVHGSTRNIFRSPRFSFEQEETT